MRMLIAGLGYVGLSTAVLLAQHNEVIATDIVHEKVDMVQELACTTTTPPSAMGHSLFRFARHA